MGKVASDKTDVLKILCDVRGKEAEESTGDKWLQGFVKACDDDDFDEVCTLTLKVPRDLLLATLGSLAKWERNSPWPRGTCGWCLGADDLTCPLCAHQHINGGCGTCPLVLVAGVRCKGEGGGSPYRITCRTGDSAPLIEALRKAVKHVVKKEKERART